MNGSAATATLQVKRGNPTNYERYERTTTYGTTYTYNPYTGQLYTYRNGSYQSYKGKQLYYQVQHTGQTLYSYSKSNVTSYEDPYLEVSVGVPLTGGSVTKILKYGTSGQAVGDVVKTIKTTVLAK